MPPPKTPESLSQKFEVVAVYDIDRQSPERLADYITALHMLKEGDRDRFFMKDMLSALDPSYDVAAARAPLQLLTGTHPAGLRLSIVQATHEGIPAYLPVIEDMQTGKLLVAGPQGVGGADAWRELTYVNAELYNRDKAVTQINDFITAAFKFRINNGELDRDAGSTLYEDIIRAFLIIAEPRGFYDNGANSQTATFGHCMAMVADGEGDVSGYVVARTFFDSDKAVQDVMSGVADDITVRKPVTFKPKR